MVEPLCGAAGGELRTGSAPCPRKNEVRTGGEENTTQPNRWPLSGRRSSTVQNRDAGPNWFDKRHLKLPLAPGCTYSRGDLSVCSCVDWPHGGWLCVGGEKGFCFFLRIERRRFTVPLGLAWCCWSVVTYRLEVRSNLGNRFPNIWKVIGPFG